MTRAFARQEIVPHGLDWDRSETVPLATIRSAGALGLFGYRCAYGGAGADFPSYALAMEELAYGDFTVCNRITATNSFGIKVRNFGTDAQKEQWLRPVASGQWIAGMALTELRSGRMWRRLPLRRSGAATVMWCMG